MYTKPLDLGTFLREICPVPKSGSFKKHKLSLKVKRIKTSFLISMRYGALNVLFIEKYVHNMQRTYRHPSCLLFWGSMRESKCAERNWLPGGRNGKCIVWRCMQHCARPLSESSYSHLFDTQMSPVLSFGKRCPVIAWGILYGITAWRCVSFLHIHIALDSVWIILYLGFFYVHNNVSMYLCEILQFCSWFVLLCDTLLSLLVFCFYSIVLIFHDYILL